MILLLHDGAMAHRDVIFHDKHSFTPSQDQQIQNRLLAADDKLEKDALIELLNNAYKPKTAKTIREKSEELTGWVNNSKVALRRHEKDTSNLKGKDGPREFLSWRDSRLKLVPNPRENYVFKHYQDTRYYMKQYREENSTLDISVPPPPRRVSAFYNPGFNYRSNHQRAKEQPDAKTLSKLYQNSLQSATFQYTRRDSKPLEGCSPGLPKYSVTPNIMPRAGSGSSNDSDTKTNLTPRKTSSSGVKSAHPTKVTVPSNQSSVSSGSIRVSCSRSNGSPTNSTVVRSEVSSSGSRTLDTLACVAAHEGQPGAEKMAVIPTNPEPIEECVIDRRETSDTDEAIKTHSRLEPSCTYHIFPSEMVLTSPSNIVSSSSTLMWNPQKSSFERTPVKGEKDAGIPSPFKQSKSKPPVGRANAKESSGLKRSKFGDYVSSQDLRRGLTEDDNDPVLKVQQLRSRNRSHSTLSCSDIQKAKEKKGRSSIKSLNQASDSHIRQGSAGQLEKGDWEPSQPLLEFSEEILFTEGYIPYFKFWNTNLPCRTQESNNAVRKWYVDSDLSMKNLSELALAEEEKQTMGRRQGPSIASGVQAPTRSLDGLTWREKLEVLREINKPPERAKKRQLRLTFFKADEECEMTTCRDPLQHDHVAHQRRIKHIIEQTKLKCVANPADFVTSKAKYWTTDPETGLDVHLNVSRPRFIFSKRENGHQNVPSQSAYNSSGVHSDDGSLSTPLPLSTWQQTPSYPYTPPEATSRSHSCIYPSHIA